MDKNMNNAKEKLREAKESGRPVDYELAIKSLEEGDIEEAIEHFNEAHKIGLLDKPIKLAELYLYKDWLAVEKIMHEAIDKLPNSKKQEKSSLHYELGFLYYWIRLVDEAIHEFKKAIELYPANQEAKNLLDWAYFEQGVELFNESSLKQACSVFRKMSPRNVLYNIGALPIIKKIEERIGELDRKEQQLHVYDEQEWLADQEFGEKEKGKLEQLKKELCENPKDVDLRLRLGKTYCLPPFCDYEKAIEQYEQILQIDRKNDKAVQMLIKLYSPNRNVLRFSSPPIKDEKDGWNRFQKIRSLAPEIIDIYLDFVEYFMERNWYGMVERVYKEANKKGLLNYRLCNKMGEVQLKARNYDQAIKMFKEALKLKDNIQSHKKLGDIYYDLYIHAEEGKNFLVKAKNEYEKALSSTATEYGKWNPTLGRYEEAIAKTFIPSEIKEKLSRCARMIEEQEKVFQSVRKDYPEIVGTSDSMYQVFNMITKVKDEKVRVLINGETGTGKELVAQAIHFKGKRKNRRFEPVDCGTLSEDLIESELFGHKKGAFTGAIEDKRGRLEVANNGTLFMDNIHNLSLSVQTKLLRFLDVGEIQRVGDTEWKKVDVRVIAATNIDLEKMVERKEFLGELYYRLKVVEIYLPPLRERREDIPSIAEALLKHHAKKQGRDIKGFTSKAMSLLIEYSWPGNIRELENVIERAIISCEDKMITPIDIKIKEKDKMVRPLEEVVKEEIKKALRITQGNVKKAAKLLKIHRTGLYKKLRKYDVDPNDYRAKV